MKVADDEMDPQIDRSDDDPYWILGRFQLPTGDVGTSSDRNTGRRPWRFAGATCRAAQVWAWPGGGKSNERHDRTAKPAAVPRLESFLFPLESSTRRVRTHTRTASIQASMFPRRLLLLRIVAMSLFSD
jgi:hypothetical protein